MDFFQNQDAARRKTKQMVFLFILAVITIVVALNIVFAGIYLYAVDTTTAGIYESSQRWQNVSLVEHIQLIPNQLWWAVTGVALLVIVGGSSYRILQLNDGGEAVARMVGARKVSRYTKEDQEKQLLNVVDEMAIASGVSVPQVYVMDNEPGINAFAAGYKSNEAVVAVTRGCMEQLDRDELQGVIAHEFSHIFNGDMRLNIRLMGVLHGILVIGAIGGYLLRSMRYSGRRSSGKGGNGAAAILVIGLALMIIGYSGVFFGRLIKAGVSRQREFLADSSAVQFTRNPEGITEALKKIGKLDEGSLIQGEHAEELSHMYFGQGITTAMAGWMATHPPLIDRIKRINKGKVPLSSRSKRREMQQEQTTQSSAAQGNQPAVADVAETIGNPSHAHMLYAAALLASIPEPVNDALALERGAKALMFALVLDGDDKVRSHEMRALAQTPLASISDEVTRLVGQLDELHAKYRLPLFDLAMPVLMELDQKGRQELIDAVKLVIDSDRKIKLEELTIYVLLRAHLKVSDNQTDKVIYNSLSSLRDEISLLLSLVSHLGRSGDQSAADIFELAAKEINGLLPDIQLIDLRQFAPEALVVAMEKFAGLSPALKERLVAACMVAVMADNKATTKELEVMRGLCASIEVPVPPVLIDD